ncbi:MAG: alpha/beta hydrolase [Balneolaceae bacterium]
MNKITALLITLISFLCFPSHSQSQDLLSWQDILEAEVETNYERIQVGADSLQFGELWLPEKSTENQTFPVVVLVHGGCWLDVYPGTEFMHPMAEALVDKQFAVWNIEYRRVGHDGGGYPGTFLEVANAADHLTELAEEYPLDLSQIIASGHSAGGHLATWLTARKNISPESPLYSENPLQINRVISLAGINDLERYVQYGSSPCGDRTVEKLVDLESRGEEAYLDTSPNKLLPLHADHFEVVAAFDSPVPPFFGRHFVQSAKNSGNNTKLILLPDAGHFEMIATWSDEWDQIFELFSLDTTLDAQD